MSIETSTIDTTGIEKSAAEEMQAIKDAGDPGKFSEINLERAFNQATSGEISGPTNKEKFEKIARGQERERFQRATEAAGAIKETEEKLDKVFENIQK